MKKMVIVGLGVIVASCSARYSDESFVGNWIEVMPANPQITQGITIEADGNARSIGMQTLKYEGWKYDGKNLILTGKSIGNGQTIAFTDTLEVVRLDQDTMSLGKHGMYRIDYFRVDSLESLNDNGRINVLDSLKVQSDLGQLQTRVYKGVLPAASCSGIEYQVTLYNYEHSGDGVYEMVLTYTDADERGNSTYETTGRMYTLRGDAVDKNAVVYQLVPFAEGETVNFLYQQDRLQLLDQELKPIDSKLNYSLELQK
ncbi:MAG TPA: copper resistance protein NlpE N-terminal domain-containing protein [Candidatus Alistipes merdigallinarum]|nr:copper resistance protein NlpE N-terminal domain-containing protein [Candidatus Alistipes merdigallinarum]